jgi:hypothetical protein
MLAAIAVAALRIKARSFTVDGGVVVLRQPTARHTSTSRPEGRPPPVPTIIGQDGKDLRNCFSDVGAIDGAEPGILLNEQFSLGSRCTAIQAGQLDLLENDAFAAQLTGSKTIGPSSAM